MPSFLEDFDDLDAWNFGTGPTTFFTVSGGEAESDHDALTVWAASRSDDTDGSVAATKYWISYTLRIDSYASVWASSIKTVYAPGFISPHSNPVDGYSEANDVRWFLPYLQAESASTGKIYPNGSATGATFTQAVDHTVIYGLRLNGASSHESLYLDGTLVWESAIDYSALGAGGSSGCEGPLVASWADFGGSGTLNFDELLWSPGTNPGEPQTFTSFPPRFELIPMVFTTNAAGASSIVSARPHQGEVLIISMPQAGTALMGTGGTADVVFTRQLDGGTIASLSNVAPPFGYRPRQELHTTSGGTTAYELGVGPQFDEGVPVFGRIVGSLSSAQPDKSGTVYLRYRR